MPTIVRSLRFGQPVEQVYAACLRLLTEPDPAHGVVTRRCEPDPPVLDGEVVTTVRDRQGERELRARITALDPPHTIATEMPGAPQVTTSVVCAHDIENATLVTVRSEASSGLPVFGRPGQALDVLLLRRRQRRAVRATFRRLRQLLRQQERRAG